jgi:proton glutamate symport protein
MRLPRLQLYTKVLIALAAGALFGLIANRFEFAGFVGVWIKPVGTAFIRLISMVVVPLVFASLVVGTASLKDIRTLGRIGAKTLLFYMCTTAIAVSVGLGLADIVRPGTTLPRQAREQLIHDAAGQRDVATQPGAQQPSLRDLLLNVIPTNPVKSLVDGQMLQIIFFALLMGICLTLVAPERGRAVIDFFKGLDEVIVRMVHVIMLTAPYGVFALIASVVADFGAGILLMLLHYSVVVLLGLSIQVLVVYSSALKLLTKTGVREFFRGFRPAQLLAFCSSSSNATLPVTMDCVTRNFGVPQHVCSFTLPLGATINMDGTALYQGVAAAFLAQIYGIELSSMQHLTVVLTATLASIGTAGIPGAGVIMLAMVLSSVGVPLQGIGIIMGVDRILDMCRTVVNVTGDGVCAVVVASTEGQIAPNAQGDSKASAEKTAPDDLHARSSEPS